MKLFDNNAVVDREETSGRHSPMVRRVLIFVLIAIPCLMIVFGLPAGLLLGPGVSLNSGLPMLGLFLSPWVTLAVCYALFKSNPSVGNATKWLAISILRHFKGLDERERLVVEQAFRLSYTIIVLIGTIILVLIGGLVLLNVTTNTFFVNLTYHIWPLGIFYAVSGAMYLLLYLPMSIIAWKEEI